MDQTLRRWQLRERTAHAHAVVDAAVGAFSDLTSYKRYLASMYRFRIPIERSLAALAWPEAVGQWRPREVGMVIEQDLHDLDVPVPVVPTTPRSLPADGLMGTLYVLEGSILGSRVLLKRAMALGLSETHGARHLALQSSGIDEWRGFLTLLEIAEPFDLDRATAASLATFAAAETAFQKA
jgi:heme oxygenase (biliverdin-IX-beta and delta-forming)